jgi:tetratricopeptide (TPR) repeat protein
MRFTLEHGTHRGFFRCYNNGDRTGFDFDRGGRLYSAGEESYQNLPSAERLKLKINGEAVAEVDVRASFITILYAMHKLDFDGDPYVIPDFGSGGRQAVKMFVAATIGNGAPIEKWSKKHSKDFLEDTGLKLGRRWPLSLVAQSALGKHPVLRRLDEPIKGRKPTSSLDAYDYYLRAQAVHFQYTKDGNDQAVGLYEQAIALDPQFAPAYAALAAALHQRKNWEWSTDPTADTSQAIAYAKSALRLGRQDALVLARSAMVLSMSSDEVELADSLFDEAIRLDPNGMSGWLWGGWAKTLLGDHQKAIDYLHRASRQSPLDPRIFLAQGLLAYASFLSWEL